jgi:hypothetical protein
MPDSVSKVERDLATLKSTVSTLSYLLTQLQTTTAPQGPKPSDDSTTAINPLSLAHDSASLIKAHATKLSLLIITPPLTPTAIITVLRELAAGPLPGLASAIELCSAATYTRAMSTELQWRAKKLFTDLESLIAAVPLDGKVLSSAQKNSGRGSLAGTGAVWDACEQVMALKTLGIAGLCIKKAEQYRDLLKDALEELQEWGDEEGSDAESEEDENAEQEDEDNAQNIADTIFSPPRHIPPTDPTLLRPRLETTLHRTRLLVLLYSALIKRRFKTLPASDASRIPVIDAVLRTLQKLPSAADELASAFYELDPGLVDARMREFFETGKEAASMMGRDWEGREDEFTAWVSLFLLFVCSCLLWGGRDLDREELMDE